MGVPAFYRWLSTKYPKMIRDCVEDDVQVINGVEVPVDTSAPNPNGLEFDNLYLDMNGIIHPCFHPEDREAPTTEAEVFQAIFDYIDRLFAIVRPRRLLYMAIDGVAPRAKMNQQRSRRFKAAKDAEEKRAEEARVRADLERQGIRLPAQDGEAHSAFDSNTITPGTPFMHRLSVALQYYVHQRLNADPGWRGVEVLLSDANAPGEGEHKVMSFIRQQRLAPGYNPNTRHCMYGLDADLIMLALATHEPRFAILREVVTAPEPPRGGRNGRGPAPSAPAAPEPAPSSDSSAPKKPYQFAMINVLREYLVLELSVPTPFHLDRERLFDDFVFMCFFVGNDFLPHMPTLEIREGAIDLLMRTYMDLLPTLGHLVEGAEVRLDRVERFIQQVGKAEEAIFQRRMRMLQRQKGRVAADRQMKKARSVGKFGTRMPDAQVAAHAQVIAQGMSKAAGLAAALQRVPTAPLHIGQAAAAGPGTAAASNKGAAAELKKRLAARSGIPGLDPEPEPSEKKRCRGDAEKDGAKRAKHGKEKEGGSVVGVSPGDFWAQLGGDAKAAAKADAGNGADNNTKASAPSSAKEEIPDANVSGDEFWASLVGSALSKMRGAPSPDAVSVGTEAQAEAALEADEAEAAEAVRGQLGEGAAAGPLSEEEQATVAAFRERMAGELREAADKFDEMVEHEEQMALGEEGWKLRYYKSKYGVETEREMAGVVRGLVQSYVEGLVWVMRYYYQGVASWNWYYPYHYAPFASDLTGLSELDIRFEPGEPFRPFDQLMGVLPAASAHALPAPFRPLFSDPASPILDFYPTDFEVDMNGKRFAWQGICKLPFIDEARLLAATRPLEARLSPEERFRNSRRLEQIYVAGSHPLAPEIYELAEEAGAGAGQARTVETAAAGLAGELLLPAGDPCPPVVRAPYDLGEDIGANTVVCAAFRPPPEVKHVTQLLPGAVEDEPTLTIEDKPPPPQLWHEAPQYGGGGRGGGRGGGGGRFDGARFAGPQRHFHGRFSGQRRARTRRRRTPPGTGSRRPRTATAYGYQGGRGGGYPSYESGTGQRPPVGSYGYQSLGGGGNNPYSALQSRRQ
ncbi:hypothetical protein QBZ16_002907 [Prototheca wickerhamii]|uniref:5'-3' exoribonuclease n=1 Tax=Prototheca wickerhamii TaxID=3111 RepID=A0AAD9MNP9_PROWI|nr:hypothetical protein QBZ16_002907 [Prototheca wickerhamii]